MMFILRSLLATACLLVIGQAFSAPHAVATCGDWLAEHSTATRSGEHSRPAAPAPCTAPQCRQSPAQPPLPTAPSRVLEDPQERWCAVQTQADRTRPLLFVQAPEDDLMPFSVFASRLDRPPRSRQD